MSRNTQRDDFITIANMKQNIIVTKRYTTRIIIIIIMRKFNIARTLKKTSDGLMAHSQTNNVLLYDRMYAVTERGVVGRQVDCSILWLQRLQSSYCPEWSLSRWQRCSRTHEIGDVVGLAKTSQAHSQQPGMEAPVHAYKSDVLMAKTYDMFSEQSRDFVMIIPK